MNCLTLAIPLAVASLHLLGAQSGASGKAKPIEFAYTSSDGTITITDYLGTDKKVTIPYDINGMVVTRLGKQFHENCRIRGLTDITIPASITNIGAVFANCPELSHISVDPANPVFSSVDGVLFDKHQTTIIRYPQTRAGDFVLPNTVTCIGAYAFSNNPGLTNITFPNSVTNIEAFAFRGCCRLVSLNIPCSVVSIGEGSFSNCKGLKSILFAGDAPIDNPQAFCWKGETNEVTTIYYMRGSKGWAKTFGGLPTAER